MTKRTLIIGNKNYSSWSLRPWIFLRKNQIDFEERQLWLDTPEFKPAIEPIGSAGKVPVLLDDQITVWDSLAIIESAIDQYHCQYAWPEEFALSAHARSISFEMHSSFMALRAECSMDIRNRYEVQLSEQAKDDIRRICEIWTYALSHSNREKGWLYGDFSAADAMFAPVVFRFIGYGVEVNALIQAYIDHVLADEDIKEWVQEAKAEARIIEH